MAETGCCFISCLATVQEHTAHTFSVFLISRRALYPLTNCFTLLRLPREVINLPTTATAALHPLPGQSLLLLLSLIRIRSVFRCSLFAVVKSI